MKKRILSVIGVLALVLSINTTTILAADNNSANPNDNAFQESDITEPDQVTQLFSDYIRNVFNNLDSLTVKDSNGEDVTNNFISLTTDEFNNGNFLQIKKLIQDQNLAVSYGTISPINVSKNLIQPLAVAGGENITKYFYHSATDTKGKFTKEWVTTLSGSISYNGSYYITWVSDPTMNLTANFGALFTPFQDNISMSSSYSGYKATFSASYKMKASYTIGGTLPLVETLDFGNYTDSFDAYASGLQN